MDMSGRRNELIARDDDHGVTVALVYEDGRVTSVTITAHDGSSVTPASLRGIPLGFLTARAAATQASDAEDERLQVGMAEPYLPAPVLRTFRVGRPDGSDEWWRNFANAYERASEVRKAPAKLIADESDMPITAVYRWIRDARVHGYLPRTGRETKERT